MRDSDSFATGLLKGLKIFNAGAGVEYDDRFAFRDFSLLDQNPQSRQTRGPFRSCKDPCRRTDLGYGGDEFLIRNRDSRSA